MPSTLINLKAIIADNICCEPAEIGLLQTLKEDLSIDSLDFQELIMECEDRFEITIPEEDAAGVRTVAGLYDTILRAQGITLD